MLPPLGSYFSFMISDSRGTKGCHMTTAQPIVVSHSPWDTTVIGSVWPHGLLVSLPWILYVGSGREKSSSSLGVADLGWWSLGTDCAMSLAVGIKLFHFREEWVQPVKSSRELGDGMRREERSGRREGEWNDTIIWFPEDSSSGGHLRYEPVHSDFSVSQSGFGFCSLKSRILTNLLVYLKHCLPYKWEVVFLSQNPDSKSKLLIRNRVIHWIPAKG